MVEAEAALSGSVPAGLDPTLRLTSSASTTPAGPEPLPCEYFAYGMRCVLARTEPYR